METTRPIRGIDLFCGGGGASVGYARAGFEMTGVDIVDQPDYPYKFIKADALTVDLSEYDFIAASPPCQHYSNGWSRTKHTSKTYPDLIGPTRERLKSFQKPYVIENVEGARKVLHNPIKLCGTMFPELKVLRHRYFEIGGVCVGRGGFESYDDSDVDSNGTHARLITNINLDDFVVNMKCCHKGKKGIKPSDQSGNFYTVCGTGGGWGGLDEWKDAMQIDWITNKKTMSQAIPPPYTEWIGRRMMMYFEQDIS